MEQSKEPKKRRLKRQAIVCPDAVTELVTQAHAKTTKEMKLTLKEKRAVAAKLLRNASLVIDNIEELKRLRGVPRFQMEARLKEMKTNFIEIAKKAEHAAKEV